MTPHLGISYLQGVPEDFVDDFRADVAAPGLNVAVHSREPEFYAGLEWLLPTALVAYVGKSYFDSFLGEMGKDHYEVLKGALKSLHKKMKGERVPKIVQVGSKGKVKEGQPYSAAFSVVAQVESDRSFKLLVHTEAEDSEVEVMEFITYLSRYVSGELTNDEAKMLNEAPIVSRTILIAVKSGKVQVVDPMSEARKS
jgi:hypothetical protein